MTLSNNNSDGKKFSIKIISNQSKPETKASSDAQNDVKRLESELSQISLDDLNVDLNSLDSVIGVLNTLLNSYLVEPQNIKQLNLHASKIALIVDYGSNIKLFGSVFCSGAFFPGVLFTVDELIKDNSKKLSAESKLFGVNILNRLASTLGRKSIPYLLPYVSPLLDFTSEKASNLSSLSLETATAIVSLNDPAVIDELLVILFGCLDRKAKWQKRKAALNIISSLVESAPIQVGEHLVEIFQQVGECVHDMKKDVSDAANNAIVHVCELIGNPDISAVLPVLIQGLSDASTVPAAIASLSGTTFVRDVDCRTLAVMTPVLVRALQERSNTSLLRQTAIIIGNMCKLVPNPKDVDRFLPQYVSGLERIVEYGADPELREVTNATLTLVKEIISRSDKSKSENSSTDVDKMDQTLIRNSIQEILITKTSLSFESKQFVTVLDYLERVAKGLLRERSYEEEDWTFVSEYVTGAVPELNGEEKGALSSELRIICLKLINVDVSVMENLDHDTVCNCVFSLAYGGMILLKKAHLHLIKGHKYGLCGRNGCGKSTLMKAIAKGQLEGFPSADKVKTVYVAHILQGENDNKTVLQFVQDRFRNSAEEEIITTLKEFLFSDELIHLPFSSLSGGWKMKLELAMAMLNKADILLLDEPTNHLDVVNCEWLVQYLNKQKSITSLIVSHDVKFLDAVCTNIIHYNMKMLKTYKGNFSKFVELVPEAKSYLENEKPDFRFHFPKPGVLDGVKSKEKKVLRLTDVSFSYSKESRQVFKNISIGISLSSRVAILGPNGAGKSTMIKLLIGDNLPTSGVVYKHPSLRVAHVAQHAFHHLEDHLDKSPNAYIRWRFESGIDKELLLKDSRKLSTEEEKAMEKHQIELICGRQKLKRSYKYEVKYIGRGFNDTRWIAKEDLEELGLQSILRQYDDKEAARSGDYDRVLTVSSVEKHLEEFGLNKEFGTHNIIKGLSGGQKVKVVLAAAMWNLPHVLILDEPTNYLDVQSMQALSAAIKDFEGGIVMVTHNEKFYKELCDEVWEMANGSLICKKKKDGEMVEVVEGDETKDEDKGEKNEDEEDEKDAKSKPRVKKLTRKEKLKKEKIREMKLRKYGPKPDGGQWSSDEEQESNVVIGSVNNAKT